MTELLHIAISDEEGGGHLVVEVDEDEPGMMPASRIGDRMHEASVSLVDSLAPIRRAAEASLRAFLVLEPTTVDLEFGVRLNASAGAVLTKAGVEGHIVVRLSWQKEASGA
ncbi:CU044_2847 family protein [Streptomyces sp. NPDC086082]|uniref:CU044_2847 family protein n=1 Tax=Streptomyces sp. NPDC086082 TaxID=3365750 RepID=UPI003800372E